MHPIVTQQSSGRRPKSESAIWGLLLLIWFIALCLIPDPHPLSAPEWFVRILRSMAGVTEPSARLIATIALRATGLGILGVLVPLSLSSVRKRWMGPLVIVIACLLAAASQWINYGYFPVVTQLELGVASAVFGALAGLALRRSWIAAGALIVLAVGIFVWGTSTGITNELDVAARAIGKQLLEDADNIPTGDKGFVAILNAAFTKQCALGTLATELVDDIGRMTPVGVDQAATNLHGRAIVALPLARQKF